MFDIKAGVSGAGREATEETHYSSGRRERERLQGRGPPPQRRDRAGARAGALQLRDPPGAARPGHSRHLLPDRSRARPTDEAALALPRRPTPPSRSWRWWTRRRTRAHVQDTNRCRVHVTVVGDRTIAFAAIDNLWKGAAGQAVQDLNLMLGLPETGASRDAASSARAGWSAPAHVTELDPTALPGRLPRRGRGRGAQAARGSTWACWCRDEPDTVSAARFTTNARVGAPVVVSRQADARAACARWWPTRRTRTWATAGAGSRPRSPCRPPRPRRSGSSPTRWAWPPPA